MEDQFLSVKNLTVEYTSLGDVIHAVNDISFTLSKGESLGLVGETGAGKTTIAKSILRILPDPPARVLGGEILLEGTDLFKLSEKEMQKVRGKSISMIFQDPMTSLNPVMPVGKQVAEVIRKHDAVSKSEAKKRAIEMLEKVGIEGDRYDEYPNQFSGGMKQRVVIAMALACEPKLLLADEPTTALDVTIQAQVLDMIKQLKEEYQTSMILISHDLGVIAGICEKVCVVYMGRILEMGSLEDIYDRTAHYYTKGLFNSLPKLDDTRKRLDSIKGLMPDPTIVPKGCVFYDRCPMAKEICRQNEVPLKEIGPGHYCRCLMCE